MNLPEKITENLPDNITNLNECIHYANDMMHCFSKDKKHNLLKLCIEKFPHPSSPISQSSSENNNICFSVNTLGGNTLNETIKSPITSGEREKPFPLIIFSSRF